MPNADISGKNVNVFSSAMFRSEDDNRVMAKKKDYGALTLQSSKTAVVIGHTGEGMQQGNVNKAVNVIAEYLESLGM